jgi:hypothetical protein
LRIEELQPACQLFQQAVLIQQPYGFFGDTPVAVPLGLCLSQLMS